MIGGIKKEEEKWYAMYTKSRAEKKVTEDLTEQGYEVYCPLEKKLKVWSDRKKWVEEPLFRGYIFVKMKLDQRYDVLNTHGAVCFVTFSGKMESIPEKQILMIKTILDSEIDFEVNNEEFEPGDVVEITHGRLHGFRGELIQLKNSKKVVISVSSIQQNIMLEINPSYITKIGHASEFEGKDYNI